MEKKEKWIKSGERLKEILKLARLTHREFKEMTQYSIATIDGICAGSRPMSLEIAETAIALVPGYRIEWLLGKDDYKTEKDVNAAARNEAERFISGLKEKAQAGKKALANLLSLSGYTIYHRPLDIPGTREINEFEGFSPENMVELGILGMVSGYAVYKEDDLQTWIPEDELDEFVGEVVTSAVDSLERKMFQQWFRQKNRINQMNSSFSVRYPRKTEEILGLPGPSLQDIENWDKEQADSTEDDGMIIPTGQEGE